MPTLRLTIDMSLSGRKERPAPNPPGKYSITRGNIRVDGFDSFYGAYMYALDRFGSDDFLVSKNAG